MVDVTTDRRPAAGRQGRRDGRSENASGSVTESNLGVGSGTATDDARPTEIAIDYRRGAGSDSTTGDARRTGTTTDDSSETRPATGDVHRTGDRRRSPDRRPATFTGPATGDVHPTGTDDE